MVLQQMGYGVHLTGHLHMLFVFALIMFVAFIGSFFRLIDIIGNFGGRQTNGLQVNGTLCRTCSLYNEIEQLARMFHDGKDSNGQLLLQRPLLLCFLVVCFLVV